MDNTLTDTFRKHLRISLACAGGPIALFLLLSLFTLIDRWLHNVIISNIMIMVLPTCIIGAAYFLYQAIKMRNDVPSADFKKAFVYIIPIVILVLIDLYMDIRFIYTYLTMPYYL